MNMDIRTPEGMRNAIRWTEEWLLARAEDPAMWYIPRSDTEYQMQQKEKRLIVVSGAGDPDVEKVFLTMGWVIVRRYEHEI